VLSCWCIHTGVSEEAQHRARGSSAWRGALDIEVSIVPSKNGSPMEIIQRKSKDAELAKTVYVRLEQVQIPGWKDEDDQPVTSAVISQEDAPVSEKKLGGKIDSHRKTFENAWWSSGCRRAQRPALPEPVGDGGLSGAEDGRWRGTQPSSTSSPARPAGPSLTCWWPRSSRPSSTVGRWSTRPRPAPC
jgi:hypothetical protein